MQDPFFFATPRLAALVKPFCEQLGLQSLPLHIHEILFAFAFYHIIFQYLAPILSSTFLPKQYRELSYRNKLQWNMHWTSIVQSVSISVLALWTIAMDQERRNMNHQERMWGYTGAGGLVQALATGYFLFDLVAMVQYLDVFGVGMLVHASSCLLTYTLGFRPVVNYYSCVFMLYELSTPFLNIHWFLDKTGMTGTKIQLYNGLTLLSVFFCCRLVWGAYSSFGIYADMWGALFLDRSTKVDLGDEMMRFAGERALPVWLAVLYMGGHGILQLLNVWWFGKMISAVKKRFVNVERKEKE